LEKALEHWRIDLHDKVCLDIGASTGGFTDCMLQHGAARVISVDTGYGQMDFRLRNDPRVRLLEKTNARYLEEKDIGESVAFVALDVSFISATLVLPAVIRAAWPVDGEHSASDPERSTVPAVSGKKQVLRFAQDDKFVEGAREIVVLVKPQFEAGRELVSKGGIVRDESTQLAAVAKVEASLLELGCAGTEWIDSPILGGEGNREFLLHAQFPAPSRT
jgi:23S rRNA (cytidine1920-2'-O)/16S rRNA (cytidine1409-2'-O)-methyltransferase